MITRTAAVAVVAAFLFTVAPAARSAAQATAAAGTLVVNGDVARPLSLTLAELKTLPRARVEVKREDGTVSVYEGVFARELVARAGVTLAGMRGDAVSSYVVATASDGYQAVFGLAELDPALTAADVMVADTIDGKPLPDRQGPLRLVAPADRQGARSVRMLQRIEVVRLRK